MADGRRITRSAASKAAVPEEKATALQDEIDEDGNADCVIVQNDSSPESEIARLRGRWELATVLNFVNVFEPIIGGDLKISAEEIENGLVRPDISLAKLHIKLLKGIPPVSKQLNDPDAWMTVLCKKLKTQWSRVAEGEIPLTAANGEEITRYKQLDPTNRLLLLKALCELRADQKDAVSYVNDSLKKGTEISSFRKDKIGGDEKQTYYWCDGNTVIGHRLYKQVNKTESKSKMKGRASKSLPAIRFHWETLATNLGEFQKVVDDFSSSKVKSEVAVGKTVKTDVLPIVEKLQKKRDRAIKKQERQAKLLNNFGSYGGGITRSCRNRRPITYTFDEYDRAIDEALEINKKRKTTDEQRNGKKHIKQGETSISHAYLCTDVRECYGKNTVSVVGTDSKHENTGDSFGTESESDRDQEACKDDDNKDDDYDGEGDDKNKDGSERDDCYEVKDNLGYEDHVRKRFGSRWSMRLAGSTSHPTQERDLGAKDRLRQRPSPNSSSHSVVPDSDDENSSEQADNGKPEHQDLSPVADSEEVTGG